MKKWLWIPIAGLLYFSTPFLFELYVSINNAPISVHQVGLLGQCSMLFPLFFMLQYRILYRIAPTKSAATLVAVPLLMLLISALLGFLYLHFVTGFLDPSFLMVVSVSNLALLIGTALVWYKTL